MAEIRIYWCATVSRPRGVEKKVIVPKLQSFPKQSASYMSLVAAPG